jgi:IMP dehydrogenase
LNASGRSKAREKHESGVVTDPQTVLPTTTLREVKD